MGLILIALGSFLVGLSGAMAPGPLMMLTVYESLRHGGWVGPLLIIGHAVLELLLIIGIILGFGVYLVLTPVKLVLFMLGGLMLIFMAVGMWKIKTMESETHGDTPAKCSWLKLPLLGAVVSLSNPYWTIWWVTFGVGYLTMSRELGAAGVTAFFLGHIASDFVFYSVLSLLLAQGKNILRSRWYLWALRGCALFLFGFGLLFISAAVRLLVGT